MGPPISSSCCVISFAIPSRVRCSSNHPAGNNLFEQPPGIERLCVLSRLTTSQAKTSSLFVHPINQDLGDSNLGHEIAKPDAYHRPQSIMLCTLAPQASAGVPPERPDELLHSMFGHTGRIRRNLYICTRIFIYTTLLFYGKKTIAAMLAKSQELLLL